MSENQKFDLHDWVNHPDIHVSISKNPLEKIEDAKLRRFKEKWLFIITQFIMIAVFVICSIFTFLSLKNNSQFTGIALNGVIGIALAMAGYYVRGKSC